MKRDLHPLEVLSSSLITMPRTAFGRWGTCMLIRANIKDLPVGDPMVLHVIDAQDTSPEWMDASRGEGNVTLTVVSPLAGPHKGWTLEIPRAILGLVVSDEETTTASTAGRSWVPLLLAGDGPVDTASTWTVSVTESVVARAMPGWMGSAGRSVRNSGWGLVEDEPAVPVVAARKANSPDSGRVWATAAHRVATNLWWTAIASAITGAPSGWDRVHEIGYAVTRGEDGSPNQLLDAYVGWLIAVGNNALNASHKEAPRISLRAPQHGAPGRVKKPSGWALLTDLAADANVPYLAVEDAADGVRLEGVIERHGAEAAVTAVAIVLIARLRAANLSGSDEGTVTQRLAKWLTPSSIPVGWEAEGCLAPLLQYEVEAARNVMLTADLGRLRIWLHHTLERIWQYNSTFADPYAAARALAHLPTPSTSLPIEDVLIGAGGLLTDCHTNPSHDCECPFCDAADLILEGGPSAHDIATTIAATLPLLADMEASNEGLTEGDAAWLGFRRNYVGESLTQIRQGWDTLRVKGHVCPHALRTPQPRQSRQTD